MSSDSTSRWRLHPSARRLRVWREAQLASFAAVLDGAVLAWIQDWGLDSQKPATCANAERCDAAAGWLLLGRRADGAAWIRTGVEADLCRQLLGTRAASTPIAAEVLVACRRDLCQRLSRGLQLGPAADASEPAPALGRWSGAVEAQLTFDVRVLADAACVAALLDGGGRDTLAPVQRGTPASFSALHPLGEALADLPVPLAIRLHACEIDLGSLQDLAPGDVVRLPHALDAPVAVVDSGGQQLFCGQLAHRQGLKAVELATMPT